MTDYFNKYKKYKFKYLNLLNNNDDIFGKLGLNFAEYKLNNKNNQKQTIKYIEKPTNIEKTNNIEKIDIPEFLQNFLNKNSKNVDFSEFEDFKYDLEEVLNHVLGNDTFYNYFTKEFGFIDKKKHNNTLVAKNGIEYLYDTDDIKNEDFLERNDLLVVSDTDNDIVEDVLQDYETVKRSFNNIATDFVTLEFINDQNKRYTFIKLIFYMFKIIYDKLNKWDNTIVNKNTLTSIIKGGIVLRYLTLNLIKNFTFIPEEVIINYIGKNFKIGDFDFQIMLNEFKNIKLYSFIFKIFVLCTLVLKSYLVKNIDNDRFFSFYSLSKDTQISKLKKLSIDLEINLRDTFGKKKKEGLSKQEYLKNDNWDYSKLNTINKTNKSRERKIEEYGQIKEIYLKKLIYDCRRSYLNDIDLDKIERKIKNPKINNDILIGSIQLKDKFKGKYMTKYPNYEGFSKKFMFIQIPGYPVDIIINDSKKNICHSFFKNEISYDYKIDNIKIVDYIDDDTKFKDSLKNVILYNELKYIEIRDENNKLVESPKIKSVIYNAGEYLFDKDYSTLTNSLPIEKAINNTKPPKAGVWIKDFNIHSDMDVRKDKKKLAPTDNLLGIAVPSELTTIQSTKQWYNGLGDDAFTEIMKKHSNTDTTLYTTNNHVNFKVGDDKSWFNLSRIKHTLGFQIEIKSSKASKSKLYYHKIRGEIFDCSIPISNIDTKSIEFLQSVNPEVNKNLSTMPISNYYENTTFDFNIYSYEYNIKDIIVMLFDESNDYPPQDIKYNKRLIRLITVITLNMLKSGVKDYDVFKILDKLINRYKDFESIYNKTFDKIDDIKDTYTNLFLDRVNESIRKHKPGSEKGNEKENDGKTKSDKIKEMINAIIEQLEFWKYILSENSNNRFSKITNYPLTGLNIRNYDNY